MFRSVWIFPVIVIATQMVGQAFASSPNSAPAPTDSRPRVIVTTDGEVDDRCSMVRFLLYANEWDILGLIHSSSVHHWQGDQNHKAHSWQGTAWLDKQLDRYEQAYPSLKQHDVRYPSPEHLRKQVFVGNVAYPGDMSHPTPGSARIVEVLLAEDHRPVWLQAWGGANTIAQALKTIKDEHPDRVEEVCSKAVAYLIHFQDDTCQKYIAPHWPGLRVIANLEQFSAIAYGWRNAIPRPLQAYFGAEWMRRHILRAHGPLCGEYEAHRGAFRSEGDSPAFMHLIDVGLDNADNPLFGGWGGRFVQDPRRPSLWIDAKDDGNPSKPIWRWAAAFQNDWAARADWCVSPPAQANHPPKVALAHEARIHARPGEVVKLDASVTVDPDGDELAWSWWHYAGPSTYAGAVSIESSDRSQARVQVPQDFRPGQTIHVICEVTDNGEPGLTRYRRVIIICPER